MAIVTEDMVRAAHQQLPGISNRLRVRKALEAACALIPEPVEPVCEIPVTAQIKVVIDQDAFTASTVVAIHDLYAGMPLDTEGRICIADLEALLAPATSGVIHTGAAFAAAGVTEIATRLNVAKSTVTGWATRREQNGMPEPIWQLASGAVYDLDAVVEWYEKWKSDSPTIGANDGGR